MADLIKYIKKSHIIALEKFKADLEKYKETCDPDGVLYENAHTSFTLSDIAISDDGQLFYTYDGTVEFEVIVRKDEETGEYFEKEFDGIMDYVNFWSKCLKRVQRYWSMTPEELDAIQNGEADEINE